MVHTLADIFAVLNCAGGHFITNYGSVLISMVIASLRHVYLGNSISSHPYPEPIFTGVAL